MDALASLNFTEAGRMLQIDTPAGKDAYLTEKFWCQQIVNGLDDARVTLRAKRDDVKAEDIVGKEVTVSLSLGHGLGWRKWNYLVKGLCEQPRLSRDFRRYELILCPTVWLMSQRADCRIFLNKSVIQIAETFCDEHGIHGLDTSRVFDLPPPKPYRVQWNETDLDFLMRVMQEYGVFFWTRQDDGKQVLVLANKPVGYDNGADGDKGRARISTGSTDTNRISEWRTDYLFVPGKHAGRDWNFQDPNRVQSSEVPSTVKLPRNGSYEIYRYPAEAMNRKDAEKQMTSHAQASEASHQTIVGESDLRELAPGAKVTPFDLANPQFAYETAVIMSIEHEAVNQSFEATEGDTDPGYTNRFTALPANLPATPQRTIPRPRIDGSQIAIVAGPAGEEIHCNEFGAIKLKHHWDRRARGDGTDTDWVRVGQPWAGGSWGMQVIPRIGMEAVVTFEDGDPDRPLVTALLPNPNMKVPEDLPANKTRMILKSKTYKGTGFNEMRFEDQTAQEEIYVHAQKDMNTKVLNNNTESIDNNDVQHVGNNRSIQVGNDHTEIVGGQFTLTVGSTTVGRIVSSAIAKIAGGIGEVAQLLGIPAALNPMSGRAHIFIEKAKNEVVGVSSTESIGAYKTFNVGKTFRVGAGKVVSISSADMATVHGGSSLSLTSGGETGIHCGDADIRMGRDGSIVLKGKILVLDFDEGVEIMGNKQLMLRAEKVEIEGDNIDLKKLES